MTQTTATRTQDEIVARIRAVEAEDWMGFHTEVLLDSLDYEHAKGWLKPETTAGEWDRTEPTDLAVEAREYLDFAVGKILDHRGISAGRSVDKLTELAWLLGRDDVLAAMDTADYPQYGAPKVKVFAHGMGWADLWPAADVGLERMAAGEPCRPGCQNGCGR